MDLRPKSKATAKVWKVDGESNVARRDELATEEPMEVRLEAAGETRTVAVTMRTPGNDFELAAGFLYSEGVVQNREQVHRIVYCLDRDLEEDQRYNIVTVELGGGALPDLRSLDRHFFTSTACGVCGKASLEALQLRGMTKPPPGPWVLPEAIRALPDQLRAGQGLFEDTGGLHAAGLFDSEGKLLALREDVGRHNAVDKLIGWALLESRLPLHEHILLVSGRASFEILQKSLAAGLPMVCAVSAPTNLAVTLAREYGITLIGFLRGQRFNVYHGLERVRLGAGTAQSA